MANQILRNHRIKYYKILSNVKDPEILKKKTPRKILNIGSSMINAVKKYTRRGVYSSRFSQSVEIASEITRCQSLSSTARCQLERSERGEVKFNFARLDSYHLYDTHTLNNVYRVRDYP